MKKIKYFLIILLLLVTGCKKNSFNQEEFIEQAKFNGYLIENNMTGYETHQYINDIYYAVNRENAYDIQFIKLENDDYAKKFFLVNVDDIRENITSSDYIKSNSLSNYEYFHAENDSTYYLVARSTNNIIYISAPIGYINQIEEFLTDLDIDF